MTECDKHPGPEEWRAVPGASGYQVSNRGGFRGLDRLSTDGRRLKGKPLKPRTTDDNPYPSVKYTLDTGRQTTPRPVHQIVLEAFTGPCPPGREASHLDDVPDHNCAENLIWDTPDGNRAVRMELHPAAPPKPKRICVMCQERPVTRGGRRCPECVAWLGREAASDLREGRSILWSCARLKYPSAEGLQRLAERHGDYVVPLLPGDAAIESAAGHAERRPSWLRSVTARLARRAS